MSEKSGLDEPRWSPEVQADWESGTISALEADALEPAVPIRIEMNPDRELDRELERLAEMGYSDETAARMLGVGQADGPESHTSSRDRGPGYLRDGSRRRIRTAADARAADRLPDDQWHLR